MCVSGGKKCLFSRKFDVLCFLETPILRFALLPYYEQHNKYKKYCDMLSRPTKKKKDIMTNDLKGSKKHMEPNQKPKIKKKFFLDF